MGSKKDISLNLARGITAEDPTAIIKIDNNTTVVAIDSRNKKATVDIAPDDGTLLFFGPRNPRNLKTTGGIGGAMADSTAFSVELPLALAEKPPNLAVSLYRLESNPKGGVVRTVDTRPKPSLDFAYIEEVPAELHFPNDGILNIGEGVKVTFVPSRDRGINMLLERTGNKAPFVTVVRDRAVPLDQE